VPQIRAVVNGASYAAGPVCPGEVVAIFGTGLGPAKLAQLTVESSGLVSSSLAETRVLFDGVPAPLLYTSSAQVGAVAPFGLAGKTATQVVVEYKRVPSSPFQLAVAASAPGVFTRDSSGQGLGAIVNQDGRVNTYTARVKKGEIITLYMTGAGQLDVPPADGAVTGSDLGKLLLPVSVRIGGKDAEILYAGPAPVMIAGVTQVNARIPLGAGPGNPPVEVRVGGTARAPEVRVAIGYADDGTPGMMQFLDNGLIRAGVDLSMGGAITYLADSRRKVNMVNNHDLGRQVQVDYNSGPVPYHTAPAGTSLGWNPTQAGDNNGFASETLDYSNDGSTIYVKSIPRIFTSAGEACECFIEIWMSLDGRALHLRSRLTNRRTDKTWYEALYNGIAALYATGDYSGIETYTGSEPFTGAPLQEIRHTYTSDPATRWASWQNTEGWGALVDRDGWGFGVYAPSAEFILGAQVVGADHGVDGDATGVLAIQQRVFLDYNIDYDSEAWIIVGTVQEIRDWVYANRLDTRPLFVFNKDRRNWWLRNVKDQGWPVQGYLRLTMPDSHTPILYGPRQSFRAADVPKLYVRAAYRTRSKTAAIYWSTVGQPNLTEELKVEFPIIPDGQLRTYEVDLTTHPGYIDLITSLGYFPLTGADPGGEVDLYYISSRKLE
jgi:uncharacterized protein (TIGR03437 family)